jgi:zinc transport system permease protein
VFEFFHALADPANVFLRCALLTGILASVACGIVGSYVVVRRITYIAAGIAHSVFGGLGAAYYLQRVHGWQVYNPLYGWQPLHPLHGAIVAALLAAVIIGWVSLRARQREDTVISAVWAIGMATGVLFMQITPGYGQDLMSYLFGSIYLVSPQEVWLVAGLDVVVVGVALLFYKQFLAVCFDEEHARLRGVNVVFYYLLLLCLTALTVVLLISVVGNVLVIALFTLPVAVAGQFTRRLAPMMALAVLLSMLLTTAGLALSYPLELPGGATTIVLAGVAYLLALVAGRLLAVRLRSSR